MIQFNNGTHHFEADSFPLILSTIRRAHLHTSRIYWVVSANPFECKQLIIVYHTITLNSNCLPDFLHNFLLPSLSLAVIKSISSGG